MSPLLTSLVVLAGLAVVVVLLAGIWNLARQPTNPQLSQRLMRWRVGLQLLAVLIVVLALLFMR